MAQDGFRLERIYRLRSRLCDVEELKTMKATTQRDASRDALEDARGDLQASDRALVESGYGGCKARTLHRRWWHRVGLERKKDVRERDLQEKERLVHESQERLKEARTKKEVLAKLREKTVRRLHMDKRRREQKAIDELASRRHVLRGGERGF